MTALPPRILQVRIRSYKSIASASVDLAPFTVLVGPNGSGKSNFVDAMSFVQEALAESIEQAFKRRGGIGAVRRRSGGHPTHIALGFMMQLEHDAWADYSFEIAAQEGGGFRVAKERCIVHGFLGREDSQFEIKDGKFTREIAGVKPKVASDRLMLYAASALDEFRPVYDFLASMRFYSISPDRLRELQDPDMGQSLKRDGSNAAAVLKRLNEESKSRENGGDRYSLLCGLLSRMVDGIEAVEYKSAGQKETLSFKQDIGLGHAWSFDALNMSDGTLRSLGVLLAVFQPGVHSLIAIEEPEATVNPAVSEVIMDALVNASAEKQVIVTTHSPEVLDYKGLSYHGIRAVQMTAGKSTIAPISPADRAAIRDRLFTPGELLRNGELGPDPEAAAKGADVDIFQQPDFPGLPTAAS